MTIRPQSLWGRLILLLLGVLFVAQMLSAALHFRDRGEVLKHATGYNSAQRIAGMVKVLDGLPPERRKMVATELDLPALRIRLSEQPEKFPDNSHQSPRAELFHKLLHFRLGRDRPIHIYMPTSPGMTPAEVRSNWGAPEGMAPQMRQMMWQHRGAPLSGYSFIVQIELAGGQWASFAYHLPAELAAWPWDLLVGLLILLAAVLLVSFFAVRWLTKPLSDLAQAAEQLGKDISQSALEEVGPTEVRRAAHAFNRMQHRLARFVEERTRILAAVSHDLKTPITRMRLRAEKIDNPELRNKFESDLQDMQTLVQSSLDFMRGMALQEKTQLIDVDALLDSLAEDAQDMGQYINVKGEAETPYSGKPLALKRCFGNLLDNALRYGDGVSVTVENSPESLKITVGDHGPGLPEDMLDKVFEPFFRAEPSRNVKTGGTGLGLSIARNIARGHGGDLVLRNRKPLGLEAVVTLPR